LFIPSSYAYGSSGSGSIPGNTPIAFDIELVDVK
jgi:FKBP-type peptidyl-prolyl cis-trans isomerase